nr:MAG TPA: hypothetical protein [Caudoviricetes sp.]
MTDICSYITPNPIFQIVKISKVALGFSFTQ